MYSNALQLQCVVISVGDWGDVQWEIEGVGFGEELSPSQWGVWGLSQRKF